jgi:hypothetical protein
MKLLEVLPLLEARRNPEQNLQMTAYQQLLKYKDNPNVYISMTDIPKLGLNPLSKFDTPLGIYCYPLKEVWAAYDFDTHKSVKKLPYVSKATYIQVLEWNGKGKFMDVADYSETDLKEDIKQLRRIMYDNDAHDSINIAIEEAYNEHMKGGKNNNYVRAFFSICRKISLTQKGEYIKPQWADRESKYTKPKETNAHYDKDAHYQKIEYANYSNTGRKWNSYLRQLGYAGLSDKQGLGVIHSHEPIQAFFLSMEYVNRLEQFENKDKSGIKPIWLPMMVLGGNASGVVIYDNQEIIIAPAVTRKQSMTYQQAVEYCKNLKIGGYSDWRLPTTYELFKLAKDYHVSNTFKLHDTYWAQKDGALESVQFYDTGIVRHPGPDDTIKVLAIKTRTVKW